MQTWHDFQDVMADRGLDSEKIITQLDNFCIETPSWGYAWAGTRFKAWRKPGVPRNAFEKIEDAAAVHRYTGIAPSIALHIPWDHVTDFRELKEFARSRGLSIGAINPNLFQDEEYRLGSLCHDNQGVREKAISHVFQCIEIAQVVDSTALSLWLADGSNYPGQSHFRRRRGYLEESLLLVYQAMPSNMRLLLEYKFFEPAFYHTDVPDWGTAYSYVMKLGERAQVLVDLGHHPLGTNIEQIVATLLAERKLGGFHFNDKKYADDDLVVGSSNPFQLFLIFNEIVDALGNEKIGTGVDQLAYMIDQSPVIEPALPAMVVSLMNVQTMLAKALCVNRSNLYHKQGQGDILGAHGELMKAYHLDVEPLLHEWRRRHHLPPDPYQAFLASGYLARIEHQRT